MSVVGVAAAKVDASRHQPVKTYLLSIKRVSSNILHQAIPHPLQNVQERPVADKTHQTVGEVWARHLLSKLAVTNADLLAVGQLIVPKLPNCRRSTHVSTKIH